jgi:hypothetical protein
MLRIDSDKRHRRLLAKLLFVSIALGIVLLQPFAQKTSAFSRSSTLVHSTPPLVPAYHRTLPRGRLPATVSPNLFRNSTTRYCYMLAAKIRSILYQLPCYCRCDLYDKHSSLLDCYTCKHASECEICKQEAIYAYQEFKKGRSAREIRREIIAGKWKTVSLTAIGR